VLTAEVDKDNALEISMLAGQDARPEIARQIVKHKFDLLEMQTASLSLEDIFMQLTQDEPSRPSLDGSVDA
jgi:hypothetical protein